MTVSELFRAHGIDLDERQALDLIEAALAASPGAAPTPSPLAPGEAAIYDAAGMADDAGALQQLAAGAAAQFVALLATAVPVTEAAARIGVSRSRLQQMITSRDVWALRRGTWWVLPQVQFDGAALIPGWSTVAGALPASAHPLEVLGFITTRQPELSLNGQPQTVIDWLRSGGDPEVAASLTAGLRDLAA